MKKQIHLVNLKKYIDSSNQEVEIDLYTDAVVTDEKVKMITFFEKDKTKQIIKISSEMVTVDRIGQSRSKLLFIENHNTPYELDFYSRKICLDIYTEKIEIRQNYLKVVYQTEIDKNDHTVHQLTLWF